MKSILLGAATLLVLSAGTSAAQPAPQSSAESRWRPWLGCWQLADESVRDQFDVTAEEAVTDRPRQSRAGNSRICVTPAPNGAVTMKTIVGTATVLEETIEADGASHQIAEPGCTGTKRAEWSSNGRRLFTRAEIRCGDQSPRTISSLTMMTGGPAWVDIQMIDLDGRKNIRLRRYEPVQTAAQPATAPFSGETSWTLDDVKEASAKLARETVQAALIELGRGFNLNSKRLVELGGAGVPGSVIDLMIALSYPKKFVIERTVSAGAGYSSSGYFGYPSTFDSWWWIADAMFWPNYYSPFGYRYWGYYDPYYVPYSGYVPVTYSNAGPTGNVATGSGQGRVVDGLGYTRIRSREPDPSTRANNGSSNGSSGGYSGTSTSGSGGSGVSTSGYSGGGGGGSSDGGRTAVPRPPGGD